MMLCLLGMVVLFGGTRLWAAGPFWLPLLLGLTGMLGFTFLQTERNQTGICLPPHFFFWGLVPVYVAVRAAFFSGIPFETWTEFCFLLSAWLLYGVMCDLGNQKVALTLGSFLLLSMVLILSVWAIRQHWEGTRNVLWIPRPAQYGMRASGTYICPNHFAHFLQMGMILAFGLILTPKIRISLRIFSGYVLIPVTIALVLTHSRSGLIGAFAGVSVICLCKALRRGWRRVLLVLTGLGVAAVACIYALIEFYPPMRARILRDVKDNIRISQVWPDTWSMIKAEGFWGAGPGVYANVFEKYREHFVSSRLYLEYAHNEILNTLAEYGWLVSCGMLVLLIWMNCRWVRAVVNTGSDHAAMIPAILLALTAGTFSHAVFDFNLHIPANGFLFVGLLGWLTGQGLYLHVWKISPLSVNRVRLYTGIGTLAGIFLMICVTRMMMWSRHEYLMDKAEQAGDSEKEYMHAAEMRSWLPRNARGWTKLGIEYREKAFWLEDDREKRRMIDLSKSAYLEALSLNHYEKVALAGMVELARMEERPEEALKLILSLRELTPFDQQVRVMHGLILRELGRPEEALEVFQQAKKLNGPPSKQIELNIRSLQKTVSKSREASN